MITHIKGQYYAVKPWGNLPAVEAPPLADVPKTPKRGYWYGLPVPEDGLWRYESGEHPAVGDAVASKRWGVRRRVVKAVRADGYIQFSYKGWQNPGWWLRLEESEAKESQ
jgi:hypothetical protein